MSKGLMIGLAVVGVMILIVSIFASDSSVYTTALQKNEAVKAAWSRWTSCCNVTAT